ncbi:MAG: response regulator transcription factor [Kiritimatiellae bacterium]|nr:response regulator transcription factor [Kiritimatiellia bacterium]MBQ3343396.1 response regulator transcription factor [Kiritimatiellia bacterium]
MRRSAKIRVLIADDHAMVRMGLASLLGTEPDIEVVGEAEDGDDAVKKAVSLRPDVVVMDLVMPKKDGAEATSEIHGLLPEAKILLLTTFGTADGVAHALASGATGAMMKNADFSDLAAAVRTVASGGNAVSPEIERFIREDPPVTNLTKRQGEILAAVVRGLTNDDIAKQFSIQRSSVKDHLTAIFDKLGAANRAEAISIALRKHLLRP